MVEVLLDSVILIDHLNGRPAATDWLAGQDWHRLAVSAITRAEVLAGTTEEEYPHIARLLDSFTCLPLDARVADRAALMRRREGLRLPDAFQAATAEIHRLELITRDTRDFRAGRFDYVTVPYRLED